MKSFFKNKDRLLAGTIIAGASVLGMAPLAHAQDNEEIVVTGSRIPQPNLESVSPVQVMGEEEIIYQGRVAVEDLLATLPSVSAEFNQGVGNGAFGVATTQLRGIGSKRTLVLVNGSRVMAGDPRIPVADLNLIPSSLIERVEVVTGGASAVYGSDAVAGVVNFIMRDDFEGIRVDGQTSFGWHNNDNSRLRGMVDDFNAGSDPTNQVLLPDSTVTDAETYDLNLVMGVNSPDGRGNITAYAGYRRINPLAQSQRDYGACGVGTVYATDPADFDTQICLGSGNSAFGRFVDFGLANNPDGTNTFVPYAGGYGFNFGPFNYYQQDSTRYVAGFFGHYELNEHAEVYSELLFADNHQEAQAAPSGLFFNNGPIYSISCDNPYMSSDQADVICGPDAPSVHANPTGGLISDDLTIAYRLEGVPRNQNDDHVAYQLSGGVRGAINDAFDYDLHAQYGSVRFAQQFTGDLSNNRINQALNATLVDGQIVCADPDARAAGCVPLNIFQARGGVFGTITPEQANWVLVDAFQSGMNTTQIVSGTITGDLSEQGGRLPWAQDGIGVAFGVEYRRETLELNVDSLNLSGDLSGSGGVTPPASGTYDVFELFGEARIPIVQDAPLFHDLALEVGYRYSDYSIAGSTNAYKVSADWAPTEDIRFRAGYNRAVRAPNIVELFSPQVVGLGSFDDPCSGGNPAAGCANTFATPALAAAQLGSVPDCAAAQCSQLLGSPFDPGDLKPEEADTITVGFVFTPTFFPGFNMTLDYYDIEISEPVVAGVGGALTLAQCITAGLFCENIHRDPDTGALFGLTLADGYVINLNQNSGSIQTTGFDITGGYRFDIGSGGSFGSLALAYSGTLLESYETEPTTGGGSYDCVGLYGLVCGQPLPEYRHQMRATWQTPMDALALSLNWRHLSEVKVDVNEDDPFLNVFPLISEPHDSVLPSYDYFDVSGTLAATDTIQLRFGVNNVTDEDPPVVDGNNIGLAGTFGFGNGNTFPGVYDTLGRVVFLGFTADF